jgi:hypothetical protein
MGPTPDWPNSKIGGYLSKQPLFEVAIGENELPPPPGPVCKSQDLQDKQR